MAAAFTPNRDANEGSVGDFPNPQSQICVAESSPFSTRAWLAGDSASKATLRSIKARKSHAPEPIGRESAMG